LAVRRQHHVADGRSRQTAGDQLARVDFIHRSHEDAGTRLVDDAPAVCRDGNEAAGECR
jgi:hypothetical protein